MLSLRGVLKLQSDHRLLFKADWQDPAVRLRGVRDLVRQLAEIATASNAA
jgi:transcription-repair coupling factor (superfamily II helicase)